MLEQRFATCLSLGKIAPGVLLSSVLLRWSLILISSWIKCREASGDLGPYAVQVPPSHPPGLTRTQTMGGVNCLTATGDREPYSSVDKVCGLPSWRNCSSVRPFCGLSLCVILSGSILRSSVVFSINCYLFINFLKTSWLLILNRINEGPNSCE